MVDANGLLESNDSIKFTESATALLNDIQTSEHVDKMLEQSIEMDNTETEWSDYI